MIYVDIGVNNHESIGRCFLYVPKKTNGCVYTRMVQQVYNGVQTDGIPYNTTPRGWPSANNTRYYRCSFTAPYMMYSATTGKITSFGLQAICHSTVAGGLLTRYTIRLFLEKQ